MIRKIKHWNTRTNSIKRITDVLIYLLENIYNSHFKIFILLSNNLWLLSRSKNKRLLDNYYLVETWFGKYLISTVVCCNTEDMCAFFDPILLKVPTSTKLELHWDIRIFNLGHYNSWHSTIWSRKTLLVNLFKTIKKWGFVHIFSTNFPY